MVRFRLFIVCLLLIIPQLSFAAKNVPAAFSRGPEEQVLGIWRTEDKCALVEISRCGERLCGKVAWIKDPNPLKDSKNPDPALRGRSIVGLPVIKDGKYAGEKKWRGHLYNPENGKTYSGEISLTGPDTLKLRGYILLPLFGATTVWTRAGRHAPDLG